MTSPGRHETERRCRLCGNDFWAHDGWTGHSFSVGTPPAAPPPDEGETERREADEYARTGGARLSPQQAERARELRRHRTTPPVVPVQPEETDTVNETWQDLLAQALQPRLDESDAEWVVDLVAASRPVQHVHVEWGVRYRWPDSQFRPDHLRTVGYATDEETARLAFGAMNASPSHTEVEMLSRTVTTSPWVPVTDEQDKEQGR